LLPENGPHNVREVYVIQWERPGLVIDVTDTMELKLEAIRCHASQIDDFTAFEARMRNRAAIIGQDKGYSYAEGFDQIVVPA
jgi:LmbE family N-acetylglucosaminyl deacetylase